MKDLILPAFSTIVPEEREQQLLATISSQRTEIGRLTQVGDSYTWSNFIFPLEAMANELHALWAPFVHLKSVMDSRVSRDIYARCKDAVVSFEADVSQNKGVYNAFREIREGEEYPRLSGERKKVVDNTLLDFRLAGVHLSAKKKMRFKEIKGRLAFLAQKFEENLLDSTNAWSKDITDEADLAGLPSTFCVHAQQIAKMEGLEGWRLLLNGSTVISVLVSAHNRKLRREVYEAWNTRASDRFSVDGEWDNLPICEEILSLRQEFAELLGFTHYAEMSLVKKMAENTSEVMDFLQELAFYAKPKAEKEYAEIVEFAKQTDRIADFQAWDLPYYSERLKKERFSFSNEEIREYFPLSKVLAGMLAITERFYGIRFEERTDVDVWHQSVRFFNVLTPTGAILGGIYFDLYTRKGKEGEAWADRAVMRWRQPGADGLGDIQKPVGYLSCNFELPIKEGCDTLLLSHREVITFFHEFGHNLHYTLTQTEAWSLSGVGGVERDGVELPSQFMEHFCLEKESIDLISGHYQTGEKLPTELFEKMREAMNFGKGLLVIRQLIFGIFDFRLHNEKPRNGSEILKLYCEVFGSFAPGVLPEWVRTPNNFSHIFSGEYAAGYYSYVWADVPVANVAEKVFQNGRISWEMGKVFRDEIFAYGGARPIVQGVEAVLGHKIRLEPLLKKYGFLE